MPQAYIFFLSFPLAHKSDDKKTKLHSYSSAFLSPDYFGRIMNLPASLYIVSYNTQSHILKFCPLRFP